MTTLSDAITYDAPVQFLAPQVEGEQPASLPWFTPTSVKAMKVGAAALALASTGAMGVGMYYTCFGTGFVHSFLGMIAVSSAPNLIKPSVDYMRFQADYQDPRKLKQYRDEIKGLAFGEILNDYCRDWQGNDVKLRDLKAHQLVSTAELGKMHSLLPRWYAAHHEHYDRVAELEEEYNVSRGRILEERKKEVAGYNARYMLPTEGEDDFDVANDHLRAMEDTAKVFSETLAQFDKAFQEKEKALNEGFEKRVGVLNKEFASFRAKL